jgi:hypothetical protein
MKLTEIKNIIIEILLNEKADRCKRIADRKYDKPSAYKSGAIVRCRKGDIWKDLKEDELKNVKAYHSTDDKFEDFSLDYVWDGFWFTDNINALKNKEVGASGGKYIMTRYITLNNPAGWNEYDKYSVGELIDQGYDGVILPEDDRIDYLVFNPKSISKSITEDESLHKWFKRQGPKGKEGGWVDCNAPDGKGGYKACGRKKGEKRSKYPSCRPTPSQCKSPGKGKKWGKTK